MGFMKKKKKFVKGNKALLLRREDSQLGLLRNLHLCAYDPGMFSGLKMWPVFPSGVFLESLTGALPTRQSRVQSQPLETPPSRSETC